MSNNSTPKAVKQKPSLPTTTILVRRGGELFISRDKLPEVNRVLSSKQISEDTTEVKLLLIFGDTYRFRSKSAPDLGPNFSSNEEVVTFKYALVNVHGVLTPIESTTATGFTPVSLNNTLMAETYDKIIGTLTKGKHLVNAIVNEPFNIRDMSRSPGAYIGNGMLLYSVGYVYNEGVMEITNCVPLTVADAKRAVEGGIGPDFFILRQHYRESKTIQVAFEPEHSSIHYLALISILRKAVPEASIDRKGDRYNVTVNVEAIK